MPIEIKELHIKALVASEKNNPSQQNLNPELLAKLKKEITKEVTEKILKLLQQKNER